MRMTGKKVKKMFCVEAMVFSLAVCAVLGTGCGQTGADKDAKQEAVVTE